MVDEGAKGRKRFIAWFDGPDKPDCPILEDLVEQRRHRAPPDAPEEKGKFVILTSGTTGTPKGASRESPESLDPVAALFDKIPLRARRDDDDRRAAVPLAGASCTSTSRSASARRSSCAASSTPR